ncbi:transmembrane protein, putative [Medicago truncatula]|uniref:Transmembrane protein, putative n=1 Tax=Medicago truncatula TaxID=3880 RepID=G7K5P1_MEDTR|nr:transmembrane protein, putative [Medicago truncatula]
MTSTLHEIVRWVTHPKISRFVCFVSSIVGLFYYALSSSFNHLFGKWNFFKLFLYTIFSFIIFLTILFAKSNHTSGTSLPFKAHLVFLIKLLMKIKLLLVIVGVSFSYSLIILRFYLVAAVESENTHLTQPQEAINSESAENINSDAFLENTHIILPQETINSGSATIINFDFLQENTLLILPRETINSESAPLLNFDAPQEYAHLNKAQETHSFRKYSNYEF